MKTQAEKNAYHREWREKNKEKRRITAQKWRDKHGVEYDAKRREYRAANREKLQAAKEKWARENPDRVAATRALARIRRERQQLAAHLRFHYNFTLADYEALLTVQGGRCAICGKEKGNNKGHRLYIDHDHETGQVRWLLCSRCNSAIGYFADNPKRLRRAAAYLENWRGKTCPDDRRGFQPILGCIPEKGGPIGRAEGLAEAPA